MIQMLRLGIDASNIRAGGGVTHLIEMLRFAEPQRYGFDQVLVYGGRLTLDQIEDRPWLVKRHLAVLDASKETKMDLGLWRRSRWQSRELHRCLKQDGCDLLFSPGSTYRGPFRPFVTMSQNLLPFELSEARRYGLSPMFLRFLLLRRLQRQTFEQATGLIFLTDYARQVVSASLKLKQPIPTAIVPHGVNPKFFAPPKPQTPIEQYSIAAPFRLLYVSIITTYKHQDKLVQAVARLRQRGIPVVLDLVGPAYKPSLQKLQQVIQDCDPHQYFINYRGTIAYDELTSLYHAADLAIFASSCENLPNILLENMAAGLPVACSNRGPMPEVLAENGVYFDPENVGDIEEVLARFIDNPRLRGQLAQQSFERAQEFTWQDCSNRTFAFCQQVIAQSSATTPNTDRLLMQG
jgi:glycosyltransferase involved in cell wall biosynthesis